ncbi:MAG: purine-nucleoside phosphorylase [Desulfovibrio sp.]
MTFLDRVRHARTFIQEKTGIAQPGTVALVLGSGLGEAENLLEDARELAYAEIPGFPRSSVPGHASRLLWGRCGSCPVLALSGRFHLYEGFDAQETCFGVRVLGELGVRELILTNAAGALNPQFDTGTLVLISDQINFTGQSPLSGPNHDGWGVRFPDMSRVYDAVWRDRALETARTLGIRLERGVYVQVPGPQLETPAETRMLRRLGADAVGMSTALEAICARHMGMRVLGISCLTNKNLPDCMAETSHAQVLETAGRASADLVRLLAALLEKGTPDADGS